MLVAHLQHREELHDEESEPGRFDSRLDRAGGVSRLTQLTRSRSHTMERDDLRRPNDSIALPAKTDGDGTWRAKDLVMLLDDTKVRSYRSRRSNDTLLLALERDRSNMGWGRAATPATPLSDGSVTPTQLVLANADPSRTASNSTERSSSAAKNVYQASATTAVGSHNGGSTPPSVLPTAPLQPRKVGRPLPATPDDERLRVPLKVPEASRVSSTMTIASHNSEEQLASGGGSGQRSWARAMFEAGGSQGSEAQSTVTEERGTGRV